MDDVLAFPLQYVVPVPVPHISGKAWRLQFLEVSSSGCPAAPESGVLGGTNSWAWCNMVLIAMGTAFTGSPEISVDTRHAGYTQMESMEVNLGFFVCHIATCKAGMLCEVGGKGRHYCDLMAPCPCS